MRIGRESRRRATLGGRRVSASRARGGSHARDEGHRERRDARPRCVQAPAAPRGGRGTERAPRPPASPSRAPAGPEQWPRPKGCARPGGARPGARAPAAPGSTRAPSRRRDPAGTGKGPASCRPHAPPCRRGRSRARPASARARPGDPWGQAAWRAPRSTARRHGQERRTPGGRRWQRARSPAPAGQAQAGAAQKVTRALTRQPRPTAGHSTPAAADYPAPVTACPAPGSDGLPRARP
jgi:translation initiation factor IF-2